MDVERDIQARTTLDTPRMPDMPLLDMDPLYVRLGERCDSSYRFSFLILLDRPLQYF